MTAGRSKQFLRILYDLDEIFHIAGELRSTELLNRGDPEIIFSFPYVSMRFQSS